MTLMQSSRLIMFASRTVKCLLLTEVVQSPFQFSDRLLHLIKSEVLVDYDAGSTFTSMGVTHGLRRLMLKKG